ncbi:MAG: MMPL family transporter [Alphaproteobacteria bacterium]|nr:MMPL family transporter [Alphaproteobacteria bacterium]
MNRLRALYLHAVEMAEARYTAFLGAWVATACRLRWLVIAICLAGAGYGTWYAAMNLGMNTDTVGMLSQKLPWRIRSNEYSIVFPQFSDNILVVIDAVTPDLADDAAEAVIKFMRDRPKLFRTVYDPSSEPFFRRNGMLYLDRDELTELADKLAAAQPVLGSLNQDPTIRGLVDMLNLALDDQLKGNKPPVDMTDALNRIAAAVEAQAKGDPRPLSWREMMMGRDAKHDELRRLVLIQPAVDFGTLDPAGDAIDSLRDFAKSQNWDGHHGVRMRLTGSAALAQDELGSIRQQMGWISVISFVLVIILLAIGLQSVLLVVTTAICLTVGLALTTLFATVAIGSLNLLSVAFAVLFIGLSDDFGAHFTLRYREELAAGKTRLNALVETGRGNGGALTLCAVTAAISFFSFLPTDYRGVAELGLIAGVGMFVALIINLTLLPALLSFLPLKARPTLAAPPTKPVVESIVDRWPRQIVYSATAFCLLGLALIPWARFDADPLKMKDPSAESVQALFDLAADAAFGPYDLVVMTKDLATADEKAARLKKLPNVDSAVTLSSFVPSDQEAKLEIVSDMKLFLTPLLVVDQTRKPLPTGDERRAALASLKQRLDAVAARENAPALGAAFKRLAAAIGRQGMSDKALLDLEDRLVGALPRRLADLRDAMGAQPVTLADLPDDVRVRYVAPDGHGRVQIFPKEKLVDVDDLRKFVGMILQEEPDATGAAVTVVLAGHAVINAFHIAAAISLAGIVGLLVVLLGDWRETLLVLLPLILAGILTAASAVVLGMDFNFANIIVLPLLVGLGVASGIHLVLRDRELTTVGSVLETSTPRAVIVSALTTICSFGTLMLSGHKGVFSMGLLLTVGITLNLVVTLVVLPALLALRRQRRSVATPGR